LLKNGRSYEGWGRGCGFCTEIPKEGEAEGEGLGCGVFAKALSFLLLFGSSQKVKIKKDK